MDLVPNSESSNSDNTSGSGPHLLVTVDASSSSTPPLDRYESQKRRDWNTFSQYLENQRPPLSLAQCSGAHVLEFLRYLDQFGKTKVHSRVCPFFGNPVLPAPCWCPLRQAWGSLDACVMRLRAVYEDNGGKPENNPFGASAVILYLQDVKEHQAEARGVIYAKKKRKKQLTRDQTAPPGLININPFGAGAVKVSKDIKYADKEPNSDNTSGNGPHLSVTVAASSSSTPPSLSRYESRKHRDWNIFSQYLENHKPPLSLALCSGAHVLEFLRYLDQFVKTKVHTPVCPFFGRPVPPAPFLCPLCTLDACVGRLRAAYEENGGKPENNPFGTSAVMLYLQDVKEHQAETMGVSYEKRKPKKPPTSDQTPPHCLININPFGTGTVKMWKDIKYADKEPIVPWGPRYSRCSLKDMCINMAISAVFTAWIFITRSSQWRPMLFMAFAFFYRIFQKLKAFEPNVAPTYNIYGEDEKKGMGMGKRMLRSLGLVFGCIAVASVGYTGILNLIGMFGKYVPLFVYNNQELFVTTASSVLLYIMASYYR